MKDFFETLLGKYGLRAVIGIFVFGAAVWALAHWTAAAGAPVSVVWGLVEYTKRSEARGQAAPAEVPVVPPPAAVTTVPQLPPADRGPLALLKDISVFDLRAWRPLGAARTGRVSPANYINYLHIRKDDAAQSFVAHYATGGYAIDLRAITHSYKVVEKARPAEHADGREYAIEVDVSREPLNSEFLIVVEATYWNGFANATSENAATYTDKDIAPLGELALVVLFPPDKPFTSVRRLEGADGQPMDPYRGVDSFYEDAGRKFVYWSIRDRRPQHHYSLSWDW